MMSVPANTFPAACECPAKRGKCARNMTDCQLWWVAGYRNDVARRTWADRIFGLFGALVWWRR